MNGEKESPIIDTTHEWVKALYAKGWSDFPEEGVLHYFLVDGVIFAGLLLLAWGIHVVLKLLLESYFGKLLQRTKNTWDDEFLRHRLVSRLTRFFPVLLLWNVGPMALRNESAAQATQVVFSITLIVIALSVLYACLNTVQELYKRKEISKEIPLTGITQTVKIVITIIGGVLMLSSLLGKSPALIFSGFGALTAVTMLVFRDPILGLAAGIQLSSNKLLAVGDWIEVPKYGADGIVLELALTTVRVQNWDKTVTMIPTYALISDSFKNWRGMSESGVRRIKRSLNIDLNTIGFLSEEQIEQLSQKPLLQEYLRSKQAELTTSDGEHPQEERRLTNIGTYRAYIYAYIHAHVTVCETGTQLVRQLQPTDKGMPLEVYFFSKDNRWVQYENLQSDLFDHLISILPEFGLRLYQSPSGSDLVALTQSS